MIYNLWFVIYNIQSCWKVFITHEEHVYHVSVQLIPKALIASVINECNKNSFVTKTFMKFGSVIQNIIGLLDMWS